MAIAARPMATAARAPRPYPVARARHLCAHGSLSSGPHLPCARARGRPLPQRPAPLTPPATARRGRHDEARPGRHAHQAAQVGAPPKVPRGRLHGVGRLARRPPHDRTLRRGL
eukprot:4705587-Prymnesium_polylepis.1